MAGATVSDPEDRLSDLIDDREFKKLNQRFGGLNLFEAVGSVRRELNHSNFLAFLLSPTRPHGLGAEPLRRVLRRFAEEVPKTARPIRPLDIVVGDLDDAIAFRERDNIDLLIEVPNLRLVVTVENKVGANESEGQLERYANAVRANYPDWRRMFIFLTPDGTDPEHESYFPFTYSQIAEIVDDLVKEAEGSEIGLILRHYAETLRRHVVPDEHLKELALQIYERHKEALDFIFDCRPEPGSLLGIVRDLMNQSPQLVLDRQVVSVARFAPATWNGIGALNACPKEQWTKTGRNLLYQPTELMTRLPIDVG